MLKGVCNHLQTRENSSITDCKGNSGLHVAAAQKIEKHKIGRHEVIEILIQTNINPFLNNNDGKLAIDLLPKDDKRSRKVLQKHMIKMTAFEGSYSISTLSQGSKFKYLVLMVIILFHD